LISLRYQASGSAPRWRGRQCRILATQLPGRDDTERSVETESFVPGDPDRDVDRHFNPTNLASLWISLYHAGSYVEAASA
jgi:hypothetical protein